MTRRLIACLVWLSVAVAGGGTVRADGAKTELTEPRVELDRAVYADGRVRVDFHVDNAISAEMLELIHSGIAIKFRHRIEVRGLRKFMLSPRNVLARIVIDSSVTFDALTGRYGLTKLTTLKEPHRGKAPLPHADSTVTDDTETMIRWMTSERQVELYDPAGALPHEPLRVSVESAIGRRYILLFFPARQSFDAVGPVTD